MLTTAFLALLASDRAPKVDPDAMALLAHSARATFALRTYQAECRTTVTGDDPKERFVPQAQLATLRAAKPNLMRYERWELGADPKGWARPARPPGYVFACAGDRWYRQYGKIVRDDDRPAPERLSTILEPWGGFYDVSNSPYGKALDAQGKGQLSGARLDGVETVDGVRYRRARLTILSHYNGQTTRDEETLSVGPDGLVRRALTRFSFGGAPATRTDAVLIDIRRDEAIPAATYAYTMPPGTTRYADLKPPALLAAGTPSPDFEAKDADGKTVRLSDLRGKVVVLDFWASWCVPCMASLPLDQDVVNRLQAEGLPVVFLGVDDAETRDAFLRVAKKAPKTYPNLRLVHVLKSGSVSGPYRVSSIPAQYVVRADGTIQAALSGYEGPTDELEKSIRAALAKAR